MDPFSELMLEGMRQFLTLISMSYICKINAIYDDLGTG